MARMKVSITGAGDDGFIVRWTVGRSARPAGIVAVRTRNQAEALKENLEAGIAAVSAIHMALMPRRKKRAAPAKVATLGGHARSQSLSPERRSEIARAAALARHAQKTVLTPEARETLQRGADILMSRGEEGQ